MFLRQRYFLGFLCACVALALTACQQRVKTLGGPPPPGTVAQITLAPDSAGTCTQNGLEGGNVVMNEYGVTWVGLTPQTTLSIQLQNNCGFSSCTFNGTGSVSTGASTTGDGVAITYQCINIGGGLNKCPGTPSCSAGTDGLIMRH